MKSHPASREADARSLNRNASVAHLYHIHSLPAVRDASLSTKASKERPLAIGSRDGALSS